MNLERGKMYGFYKYGKIHFKFVFIKKIFDGKFCSRLLYYNLLKNKIMSGLFFNEEIVAVVKK